MLRKGAMASSVHKKYTKTGAGMGDDRHALSGERLGGSAEGSQLMGFSVIQQGPVGVTLFECPNEFQMCPMIQLGPGTRKANDGRNGSSARLKALKAYIFHYFPGTGS